MTKSRRIAGLALLVGIAIGLAIDATRPREPVYQGRTLSEWLADLNGNPDGEAWGNASEALHQIGSNAVPQIREMLRAEDSTAKQRLNGLLNRQSLIRFRFKSARDAHVVAMSACVALGPAAKEALPDLRRLLLGERTAPYSLQALSKIGPAAFPIVAEALTNANASFQSAEAPGQRHMETNSATEAGVK